MVSLESRMRETADRITVALDALLPRAQGPEARLLSAMRYAALGGGKRMRPFLMLEAGRIFDADEKSLLRVACAVECVHCFSLVHDDLPCMDDDELRRGAPTVHVEYDEATALLAGDALLAFAFDILADPETHRDPQMRTKLIAGLAKAAGPQGMIAGQALDMAGEEAGDDLIAITRMNRLKTGALFSFSIEAGGMIAAAPDDARHALSRYAQDVGLAFQIADDLLDLQGAPDETGKAVQKDAAAGKRNFVTVLGEEAARGRLRHLAAQAKGHLAIFGPRARFLTEVVDFVLDRRY
ncbi:MAG: polyprenyl synthetase family protein [Hyphomonadaceae bacterium]